MEKNNGRTLAVLSLAVATLAGASSLGAEENTGWYLSVGGGLQSREQSEDIGLGTAARFKGGFEVQGSLGYRLHKNVRAEAEFAYLNNQNKEFVEDLVSGKTSPSIGNVGLNAYSVNVYYDLTVHDKIVPYVGGGIGIYQSAINGFTAGLHTTPPSALASAKIVLDTRSLWTKTYQYRVGVAYRATPKAEIFAGFHHFLGGDLDFRFDVPVAPAPFGVTPLKVTGGKTKGAEIGVRAIF